MAPAAMQPRSRLEISFVRLLNSCINMASEKKTADWRLQKYIGTLQEKLAELRQSPSSPTQEELNEYNRKVEFLKGLLEIEKKATSVERAKAAEELPSSISMVTSNITKQSKDLHNEARTRYQKEMRDELFSRIDDQQTNAGGGVRQRKTQLPNDDLDSVLQHHSHMQEKIAEEMLHLASNMKATASAAGKIIQDDNRRLLESNQLADTNYAKLKVESDRLEVHTKKSCNWWLWIMLFMVCLTFIWMVIFIRLFPKS
ncbi:vesicle transport protein USE1-like [Tubulanus polymorphus]|uniref:vesicle transport protein USE1-like n=1 Tax=Tubulanus polymorphus TaxID=672921 RepID=UPI003DA3F866